MTAQPGLCRTCSKTTLLVFQRGGSNIFLDYEMLEVSSDDEGGLKIEEGTGDEEDVKRLKLEQDYIPPNSILLSLPTTAPIPG